MPLVALPTGLNVSSDVLPMRSGSSPGSSVATPETSVIVLVDAKRDVARLIVEPLQRRQRRIDAVIDIVLQHAVAVAVREQSQLRAIADHLDAHGDRPRALERLETRALQLSGKILSADDGSFAVQRAADHGNRDRRHQDAERGGDDDVDEGGAAGARVSRPPRPGALSVLRRNGDERLQLEEALLADALHVHQLFDPLEAAALGPVFENAFGGLAADARQRLELLERGGVEIDRGLRRRRRPRRVRGDCGVAASAGREIRTVTPIASTVARLMRMVSSIGSWEVLRANHLFGSLAVRKQPSESSRAVAPEWSKTAAAARRSPQLVRARGACAAGTGARPAA